jgi:MOSC domain-containing protein YiiM
MEPDRRRVLEHRTTEQLVAGIDEVRGSPADRGSLVLIVRRPVPGEREVVDVARLDPTVGVVGDSWHQRGSRRTPDGGPHPDMQVTLMNVRAADLVAGDPARRSLAGDQLFVDLDLGAANLPAGTRLAVGDAMLEITAEPHRGCAKFADRFGMDAARFVNSEVGIELNLRGVNARVVAGGTIRAGDEVWKVPFGVD